MSRFAHRIAGWQRTALLVSAALLLASGLGWLPLHYAWGAGAGELPHPLEAWAMRLHGLAAFAGLFVLGVLAAAHVPQGWRLSGRHRHAGQRGSGIALCTLAALLVASGYLLYYFALEAIRPPLGLAHAALGTAMVLLGGWHAGRRARPA